MNWAGKAHPVERVIEWVAPILLAAAAAWALSAAGLPLAIRAAGGVVALSTGLLAMRMAGKAPSAGEARFEPAELDLALGDDVLLLDDPLVEVASDARVVQLFEREDPTPGELVLRISDYLSEQGKAFAGPMPDDQQPVDASAALHDALANIRANLR